MHAETLMAPEQELIVNPLETQEAVDRKFAEIVDEIDAIPAETKEAAREHTATKVNDSGDWTNFKSE